MGGMAAHESQAMVEETWLTPPHILAALGPFDLDPCCPPNMPWRTAAKMLTRREDGLRTPWAAADRVFCNPPYNRFAEAWLAKMARHGNGIVLIFARTETAWFARHVWGAATAVMFLHKRLSFYLPDGTRGSSASNAGAPSCLVSYGERNAAQLKGSGLDGTTVRW